MNNSTQNSKIFSHSHLRIVRLHFHLCLIRPSQTAGNGERGRWKECPSQWRKNCSFMYVCVHLCIKRILNLQSNTCGFVIHLPRHLLLWDISKHPFNIFSKVFRDWCFRTSLFQETWSFLLYFKRVSTLFSYIHSQSGALNVIHTPVGDEKSWKSNCRNLPVAFKLQFHLQSAVPYSYQQSARTVECD